MEKLTIDNGQLTIIRGRTRPLLKSVGKKCTNQRNRRERPVCRSRDVVNRTCRLNGITQCSGDDSRHKTPQVQPVWVNGTTPRRVCRGGKPAARHVSNTTCAGERTHHPKCGTPLASPYGRGGRAQLGRRGSTLRISMDVIIQQTPHGPLSLGCAEPALPEGEPRSLFRYVSQKYRTVVRLFP